jgi:hypothetical protein
MARRRVRILFLHVADILRSEGVVKRQQLALGIADPGER